MMNKLKRTLTASLVLCLSFFALSARVFADPTSILSGQVLDASSNPVPYANLFFTPEGMGVDSNVQTDSNGEYSLGLEPGFYHVSIESLSSVTAGTPGQIRLWNFDTTVDLSTGNATQDLQLDTSLVTITVLDFDDNPVEGVNAELRSTGQGATTLLDGNPGALYTTGDAMVGGSSYTDSNGELTTVGLNGLEYQVCAYTLANVQVCNPTPITLNGDDDVEVNFPQLFTLSGTLLDDADQPVANAEIIITPEDSNGVGGSVQTDGSGNYSAELLPGSYYVSVNALNSPTAGTPTRVTLQNTDTPLDLSASNVTQDLKLDASTVTITVEDSEGTPLPGMLAELRSTGVGFTTLLDDDPTAVYTTSSTLVDSYQYTDGSGQTQLKGLNGLEYEVCAYTPENDFVCDPTPITLSGDTTATVVLP